MAEDSGDPVAAWGLFKHKLKYNTLIIYLFFSSYYTEQNPHQNIMDDRNNNNKKNLEIKKSRALLSLYNEYTTF